MTQGLKLIGRQHSHKADTNCLYKLPLCIVRLTFGFNMEEFCAAMGRGGGIKNFKKTIRVGANSYRLVYYKHTCPNTLVSLIKKRASTGSQILVSHHEKKFMSSKHRHVGCLSRDNGLQCWRIMLRF